MRSRRPKLRLQEQKELLGVNSIQEILPALTVLNMFDTDANPLSKNLATYTLIHNNSNGTLGDIENTTSLSVIGFVGHTLLEGSTTFNVNNISNLVGLQIG